MSAVCEATGADVSEVALAIGMDSRSHHVYFNIIKNVWLGNLESSVPDPSRFDTDPDPRIHTIGLRI